MTTQSITQVLGKMRSFEDAEIAAEIESLVIHADGAELQGFVARVAELMCLSEWTVRDYLRGRIKPSIRFLHAAVIASGGHPGIRVFLEPRAGEHAWELRPVGAATCQASPSDQAHQVHAMVVACVAAFRAAVDPAGPGGASITDKELADITRTLDGAEEELARLRAATAAEVKRRDQELRQALSGER